MPFRSTARRRHLLAAIMALIVASAFAQPAAAQGLLGRIARTVQNAVSDEVDNRAREEARDATRCALGDDRCTTSQVSGQGSQASGGQGQDLTSGPSALITPYPGSILNTRDYQDYTDYNRIIGMDRSRHAELQVVEGALTKLLYDNPTGRSTLELIRNYRSALEARGFQVDYEVSNARNWILNVGQTNGMVVYGEDVRYFTGRLRYNEGTAYVSVLVYREGRGFGRTNIHIVETSEMDAGMVGVDPSAMAAELDRTGEVNLRGVFFDTNRSNLKPESAAELDTIAALMSSQSQLSMDVVGHTDSTGNAAGNQLLSAERANAVRDALVARGVPANRLRSFGMGSAEPVADNATADGRAMNRRVMLVRR